MPLVDSSAITVAIPFSLATEVIFSNVESFGKIIVVKRVVDACVEPKTLNPLLFSIDCSSAYSPVIR